MDHGVGLMQLLGLVKMGDIAMVFSRAFRNSFISAMVAGATALASASAAGAATIGYIAGSGGNISTIVSNISSELGLTNAGAVSESIWNTTSATDLAASYDVLVFGWILSSSVNADWSTKLLPYLNAGGNVIWEDPGNLGDLAGSGLTFGSGGSGPDNFTVVIPGLTDSGALHQSEHYGISSFSSDWTEIGATSNGVTLTVLQTFASGGTMIVNGPDNFYHDPNAANPEHIFARNMVNYALSDSVAVPVPSALPLLGTGLLVLGIFRRRRAKRV